MLALVQQNFRGHFEELALRSVSFRAIQLKNRGDLRTREIGPALTSRTELDPLSFRFDFTKRLPHQRRDVAVKACPVGHGPASKHVVSDLRGRREMRTVAERKYTDRRTTALLLSKNADISM